MVVDKLISSVHDAGAYELEFIGDGLPGGTYFCHVVADKFTDSREMELTKWIIYLPPVKDEWMMRGWELLINNLTHLVIQFRPLFYLDKCSW